MTSAGSNLFNMEDLEMTDELKIRELKLKIKKTEHTLELIKEARGLRRSERHALLRTDEIEVDDAGKKVFVITRIGDFIHEDSTPFETVDCGQCFSDFLIQEDAHYLTDVCPVCGVEWLGYGDEDSDPVTLH